MQHFDLYCQNFTLHSLSLLSHHRTHEPFPFHSIPFHSPSVIIEFIIWILYRNKPLCLLILSCLLSFFFGLVWFSSTKRLFLMNFFENELELNEWKKECFVLFIIRFFHTQKGYDILIFYWNWCCCEWTEKNDLTSWTTYQIDVNPLFCYAHAVFLCMVNAGGWKITSRKFICAYQTSVQKYIEDKKFTGCNVLAQTPMTFWFSFV